MAAPADRELARGTDVGIQTGWKRLDSQAQNEIRAIDAARAATRRTPRSAPAPTRSPPRFPKIGQGRGLRGRNNAKTHRPDTLNARSHHCTSRRPR